MFAATLRRNVGYGPFQDLQQGLLHALSGDVPGNRGILVLAPDLVDLVDINDALLRALHVPIGILQQAQDDVLHILAHVAGFGQRGGIHDGERHIQDPRQRLGQQRLAAAGGPDQQDVGLGDLDVHASLAVHVHALVMVVDRHRQLLLGRFLPDDVLVQILFQLQWLGKFGAVSRTVFPAGRLRGWSCRPRRTRRRCRPGGNRWGRRSASRLRPDFCDRKNSVEVRRHQRASQINPQTGHRA